MAVVIHNELVMMDGVIKITDLMFKLLEIYDPTHVDPTILHNILAGNGTRNIQGQRLFVVIEHKVMLAGWLEGVPFRNVTPLG